MAADRASHSSLSHLFWQPYERAAESVSKVHLEGMSERPIAELAALARSWEAPARLVVESSGFADGGYDPGERAWRLRAPASGAAPLAVRLEASEASPLDGVALVVAGWGARGARLRVDGRDLPRGDRFRVGHRVTLEGADLVVFAGLRTSSPAKLEIHPD